MTYFHPRALQSFLTLTVLFAFASLASAEWKAPIGIPAPPFGIAEAAPPDPSPWNVATIGFYYVDQTQSAATDSGNPYGTPAKPRQTIPTPLPAGSVVELRGTYDTGQTSPNGIVLQGTSTRPVFIRGASPTARPLIRNGWEMRGTYFVLENLEFGPYDDTRTGSLVIVAPTAFASVRNSDLHGNLTDGGLGVVSWDSNLTQNVVIYRTNVHDNGDVNASYDQDVHGIAVSAHVDHLWVVDSVLVRNSGDGIQINAGSAAAQPTTHHIYVGRNTAYGNKQTGFWSKQAVDVIFSQNECHSHRPSNSSYGQCMGYQYAPDQIWFLYNHIYDCDYGIAVSSDNDLGTGTQAYFIGNVIHNIHTSDPASYNPATGWSNAAIMLAGGVNRYVINNTIFDVDAGINTPAPAGSLEIADNIIGNVTQAAGNHIFVELSSLVASVNPHHNDLFGNPRINIAQTVVNLTPSQLADLNSIAADPMFVNASAGNVHLASGSPAIDTGETNGVYGAYQQRYGASIQVDRDGAARPQGRAMDLGAYEFGSSSVSTVTSAMLASDKASPQIVGTTITWTATATGGVTPYSYAWVISADGGQTWTVAVNWTSSATFVWTPTSADANMIVVMVVKSAGNTSNKAENGAAASYVISQR